MGRNLEFSVGEYYHIYNRGVDKRAVFTRKMDYERFLALMYLGNGSISTHLQFQGRTLNQISYDRGKPLVQLCAYSLLPNHFHMVVREIDENGISRFMQKLATGYTMYFNTRNDRSGTLFQGRFKAKHAHNDRYLKHLVSYVHLNPVVLFDSRWKEGKLVNRTGAERFLEQYPYSSYPDYLGAERVATKVVDTSSLPEYFVTQTNFRDSVKEWLDYRENFKVEP